MLRSVICCASCCISHFGLLPNFHGFQSATAHAVCNADVGLMCVVDENCSLPAAAGAPTTSANRRAADDVPVPTTAGGRAAVPAPATAVGILAPPLACTVSPALTLQQRPSPPPLVETSQPAAAAAPAPLQATSLGGTQLQLQGSTAHVACVQPRRQHQKQQRQELALVASMPTAPVFERRPFSCARIGAPKRRAARFPAGSAAGGGCAAVAAATAELQRPGGCMRHFKVMLLLGTPCCMASLQVLRTCALPTW
jgi:hypothetical protein